MIDGVPSLRVVEQASLRKMRRLGEDGHILVDIGATVGQHDVLARAPQSAKPTVVDVAQELQLSDRARVARYLVAAAGESVHRGDVIAERNKALGRGKVTCLAPVDGVIASGPTRRGEVLINPHPRGVELLAMVPGNVVGIVPSRGVVIETCGTYIHALTGVGAETLGDIRMMSASPTQEIVQQSVDRSCAGCVLVGGTVGVGAIRSAVMVGARAIIVGGIAGSTYEWVLETPQPLTVVVTEAFGAPGMPRMVFDLFRARAGQLAAVFVMPRSNWRRLPAEIIIPVPAGEGNAAAPRDFGVGSAVRIIRGESSGEFATVTGFPVGRRILSSGVATGVVEVAIGSGARRLVARANVEFVT